MIMLEPSDPEEKEPSPSTSPASPQPPLDPTEPEYNQPMKEVNTMLDDSSHYVWHGCVNTELL